MTEFFDEVHATRENHDSKGEFITKILNERKISKSDALMVGDNYYYDYKSAKKVGVDALLIESKYMQEVIKSKKIQKTIKKLSDIFNYI